MIKGLDTVKKRTHLKITTISEEVTYPISVEQGSPNFFVRGPHKVIQNMSRAGRLTQCKCCGICYILPNLQISRTYLILFFHHWQNGFAGRIWPAGRSLETPGLNQRWYLKPWGFKPDGRQWRSGLPAHLRTRLMKAPSSFRATRDVMLSTSHVAATALLQQSTCSQTYCKGKTCVSSRGERILIFWLLIHIRYFF